MILLSRKANLFYANRRVAYYAAGGGGGAKQETFGMSLRYLIFVHSYYERRDRLTLELLYYCTHSKILQNVLKHRSTHILLTIHKARPMTFLCTITKRMKSLAANNSYILYIATVRLSLNPDRTDKIRN